MAEDNFGSRLKKMREKRGISTRALSAKVNKYHAYVSQIERGIINKPDYETGKALLKALDVNDELAESILDFYGIYHPSDERLQPEFYQQLEEQAFSWFDLTAERLKRTTKELHDNFDSFIDKDITRAEKVLTNLIRLCQDKDRFDFLCNLFEYDYSSLSKADRTDFLSTAKDYILSRYKYNDYGELVPKS